MWTLWAESLSGARFILKYFERTWGGDEVDSVKMPKLPGVLTLPTNQSAKFNVKVAYKMLWCR
jgi:hypothetical protein